MHGVNRLEVIPKLGVVLNGRRILYSDIQRAGVLVYKNVQAQAKAHAYLESNGAKIMLTRYVSPDLAHAMVREVMRGNGREWSGEA